MKKMIGLMMICTLLAASSAAGASAATVQGAVADSPEYELPLISEASPADSWEKRDDHKIYYYADPAYFSSFGSVYAFVTPYGEEDGWGEGKYRMTNEGDGVWSYDLEAKGFSVDDDMDYVVSFWYDWNSGTDQLALTSDCLGDMARIYAREMIEETEEVVYRAEWLSQRVILDGKPGDLDDNGVMDVQDVTFLQRFLSEYTDEFGFPLIDLEDSYSFNVSDFNGDGSVNVLDVTDMQRVIAEFDIEKQ